MPDDYIRMPRNKWERIRTIAGDLLIDARAFHKLEPDRPLAKHTYQAARDLLDEIGTSGAH